MDLHRRDALGIVPLIRRVVNATAGDFQPQDAVPVGPGGYVKRAARTPHYDGVPADQSEPAVIAIFGLGPVDVHLTDPSQPSWRQV
ncbi:MAG: hypothetical protein WCC28_02735 [Mycobacterium sp.]|uniref:hypothetical protein n=1 Tax=Mycobacterium sp. TaxID=1785 RepID=UPI003C791301